jgi:hypothetical protein
LYLLDRGVAREIQDLTGGDAVAAGRTRQALLLLRKHVNGARVRSLRRVAGERVVVIETGPVLLALRLSGVAALSLVVDDAVVATLGEGPPAWPLPREAPQYEWDQIAADVVARALAEAAGHSPVRAILSVAPAFGPRLAHQLDGSAESLETLRSRLRGARPTMIAPLPVAEWIDASLAADGAVALLPFAPVVVKGVVLHPSSWVAASALFLRASVRGQRFQEERRRRLDEARRTFRRLAKLLAHLEDDQRRMAEPEALRRLGEALLAVPAHETPGGESVQVPDPYAPEEILEISIDGRMSLARNAERLFEKARRMERARRQVAQRIALARAEIEAARRTEEVVFLAQEAKSLSPPPPDATVRPAVNESSGPRRYLTSRGLTLLVGRGAKENHHITFGVARPEDLWLHARDVPGAHVILRDDEGRARADDIRESAEVAAFFSEKKSEGRVDVHVTRRKHIRPGRGGAGRVTIGHSDTLRVEPRDPEGRLRRR